MSASAQVDITTGADTVASKLVTTFQAADGYAGFASRYCSRVVRISGETTAHAFVSMPCRSFPTDEDSVNHALCLREDAVSNQIQLNTRTQIAYAEANGATVNCLVGTLVTYCHNAKEDSLIGEIADDRWVLSKLTVFGRSVYDPSSSVYYFDAASQCIFNRGGYPDCIDHPLYGPVFAPSYRYGWQAGGSEETSEEPDPGYATTKARKWTVEDALTYLRNQYSQLAIRPFSPLSYGVQQLPNYIQWVAAISHFVGSNRELNDVNIDNMSLLSALQGLVRHGGAMDLDVEPLPDFRSNICFRNMNPLTGQTGTNVYIGDYDGGTITTKMQSSDWAWDANIRESIVNWFPETMIVGDPVRAERMTTTSATDTAFLAGSITIERAGWVDNGTHAAAKSYVAAHIDDLAQTAQEMAFLQWPDWLCAFRTGRGVDLFKGTKWEGSPLGARYARIHPSQLTAYSTGGSTNPANWLTRQIIVEMKMSDSEIIEYNALADAAVPPQAHTDGWRTASRYDNLTLSPDGTIVFLDNLRNSSDFPCFYENATTHEKYVPRELRIQLAVESTWALTASDKRDYNHTQRRINPQGPKWTYLTVSKPGDYVEFLRTSASRPNGTRISEPYRTTIYGEKDSADNELFSDRPGTINNPDATGRMMNHAACRQQDVNRIEYSGQILIARLAPGYHPGLPINVVGHRTIPCFAIVKSVTLVSEPGQVQHTIIEFGPPDTREIYDSVNSYSRHSGGGVTISAPQHGGGTYPTATFYDASVKSDSGYGAQGASGERGERGGGEAADSRTEKSQANAEASVRRQGVSAENQGNRRADKAAQRSNQGGAPGDSFGFGAGSHGSMTWNGKTTKAGEMRGFGAGNSGSMTYGGKTTNNLADFALKGGAAQGGHREWESKGTQQGDDDLSRNFKGRFFDGRGDSRGIRHGAGGGVGGGGAGSIGPGGGSFRRGMAFKPPGVAKNANADDE